VGLYVWLGTLGVPSLTFAVCFAVNVVGVLGFAWQWRGMRARMEGFDRGAKTASIDASIDEDEPLGRIRASIDRGD
jgi:hypothetical protein